MIKHPTLGDVVAIGAVAIDVPSVRASEGLFS